eukprot:jgi/Ulvmu1/5832/UM025_0090.1
MSLSVDVLVVILETHNRAWYDLEAARKTNANALSTKEYIGQICTFFNTFQLLNDSNRLAVLASCNTGVACLYTDFELLLDPEAVVVRGAAAEAVVENLTGIVEGDPPSDEPDGSVCNHMSAALSKAMCMISRYASRSQTSASPAARILILQASPDVTNQYIACMNAIFSAQRLNVAIDGIAITSIKSSFIEQAAHMTNGMYLQPTNPNALLQYLSSCFAASVPTRELLELPKPKGASFKATCFCHANAVDVGFVCSVCLSVFCGPLATCMTCGTEFTKKAKPS